MKKKSLTLNIAVFAVFLTIVFLFMENNSFLYKKDIGKITSVTRHVYKVRENDDGNNTYKEKYIRQEIKAKLLNGKHKGEEVRLTNRYESSEVYTTGYSKGDRIFLDNLSYTKGGRKSAGGKPFLTASVAGVKHDTFMSWTGVCPGIPWGVPIRC